MRQSLPFSVCRQRAVLALADARARHVLQASAMGYPKADSKVTNRLSLQRPDDWPCPKLYQWEA